MRKHTILLYTMMVALCLAFLSGCSSAPAETDMEEKDSYWAGQQYDSLTGSEFVKVAESGHMQLLLNPQSGTIRWLDSSTGSYQDTNMSHDPGVENLTDVQRSDLQVRFFSGSKNNNQLYSTTTVYDSYSMCVSREQLSYQLIDGGVRLVYMLGDDSITYKNFPKVIQDDRMQELILQYLDEDQILDLKESFYRQMNDGSWSRRFGGGEGGQQNRIGKLQLNNIYNMFYETGHYTYDELIIDLDADEDATADDYPSNLEIYVPVEYRLEGDELVVRVDTSLIETDATHPINQLTLLPYFLTSDPTQTAEPGYMFVPDGSGALIYLDSTKTSEYHYAAAYYGGDRITGTAKTYNSVNNRMMMPVLGMKNSTSTLFAVIENGAESATLDAYVRGTDNSEPFSKIKLTFDIQTQQSIASGAKNANGAYTMIRATDDIYDEDITLRYFWLGKDATYVDMAKCYASYLEKQNVLTARADEEKAPFYVELLGSTDKLKYMAGIPYDGTQILTDFNQAKEILTDLANDGIGNIKLIYSGMVNGGMNQRSLASGVKIVSGLGGKSGLTNLKSYADSIGAQIFPNLQMQTAQTRTKISNEMTAWNIVNERAQIYSFDPVKKELEEDVKYPRFVVNPAYLGKYFSKVKSSYAGKIGLDTMATGDLYTFIPTNYQNNHAAPSTGEALLKEAAGSFADGLQLMLSNPVSDAYAFSSYLTDIPTEDSGMRVLDASIPFMAMVLDGYMTYSSDSLNRESTDVYLNFMRVLESNGAPKFTFMYEDSSLLSGTEQESYFAVDYAYWKTRIAAYYEEYSAFYEKVKGAVITNHEVYERNDKLRVVTYSNGVMVYFNYSDLEEQIAGVTVPAFSYVVK